METKKQVSQTTKCYDVIFLPNGNTAVYENDEQVPELQKSWFLKFIEFLESNNVDVMNSTYEFQERKIKLIKTEEGYNWDFY